MKPKKAVAKLEKKYGIKNAYLFGSYTKDTAKEGSDVTLLIDDGGNIEGYIAFDGFGFELMDESGTDLGLLTPNSIG